MYSDALAPTVVPTCISNIATDMAVVKLPTATELAPRSKRPCGAQGWCAGPRVKAEMNAEWQQGEEMKRCPRAEPNYSNLRKVVERASIIFRKVPKAVVPNLLGDFVRNIKTRI